MSEIARPLFEEEQISSFLSAIDFVNYFSDKDNLERVFGNVLDVNIAFAQSVTLIKDANNDLLDVVTNNTLDSKNHRATPYKTDEEREGLRNNIINELTSTIRPEDDEKICYGKGGMLPSSGVVSAKREAFIIIGLPASGKSGIASKVSDYFDAVLIDSDFAKRKIPEFCKKNGATLVHKESKMIKDEIMHAAIYKGLNFVLPIIGSDYEEVLNTINGLRRHRYKVSVILVELDRVKATRRAFSRFIKTKRYIPLSKILDEYSNGPSLVFYKILTQKPNLPMALIDTDVPFGNKPKIVVEQKFREIRKII